MSLRRRTVTILGLGLTVALGVTGARSLLAQSRVRSPHGTLDIDCAECHTPERWTPVVRPPLFRHERTGFTLQASHGQVACRSCHQSLVFSRVGTACADCHQDPHRGELGTACENCHSPRTWSNQREMFAVHNRTRFPLFAVHAKVDCQACHRGQRPFEYAATPADCGTCHARTFEMTTNPNHTAAGFSRRCEDCHRPTAMDWKTSAVDHSIFPLRGAHTRATCARCHTAGYRGTPRECVGCHRPDYERTTNPNHVASRFPLQCDSCHQEAGWRPASGVDHSTTRFPLTGAHQRVECARCHVGGRYAGTPLQCVACHQPDYNRATNPNHVAGRFATTCENCHTTVGWRPAALDHDRTAFPLTGAHRGTDCARCHVGGRYAGTPKDCYSCHEADQARATNPSHAGFPRDCAACHNTNGWKPASFDHNRSGFPLTGAHRNTPCESCHRGGKYAGTAKECNACHAADYNGTNNPNHASAGFPRTCQDCHQTSAWRPASFDHDGRFFPIYSGAHKGKWGACSDCHRNAGNYKAFECILCHEHNNKREVDDDHRGVSGYTYSSAACYRCHPRGRE
jgi:hypothetical protein